MQRSSWMIVLMGSLAFLMTAYISFKIGETKRLEDVHGTAAAPLVVVPLDEESSELLENLAQSRSAVTSLEDELAELKGQLQQKEDETEALQTEMVSLLEELENQEKRNSARLERGQTRAEDLSREFGEEKAPLREGSGQASSPAKDLAAQLTRQSELDGNSPLSSSQGAAEPPEASVPAAKAQTEPSSLKDRLMDRSLESGLEAYKAHDYEAAYRTWLVLAKQGVGRAQFYVGGLYLDGHGVEKDNGKALYWLSRAQEAGYAPSATLLEQLMASMSTEELAAAEKLLASRSEEAEGTRTD